VHLSDFLRPFIESGELLAVVEALPEQIPVIEERDPLLLRSFERIDVEEPPGEVALRILQRRGESCARRCSCRWQPGAIEEAERLHRRYASYSAHPGRPLRLLEHVLADAPPRSEIGIDRILDAFSRQTGLPRFMLDDNVPLDLTATRRFFTDRVLGQPEPVDLLVDLLATIKARLARPRRPLASMLFIGPTGVGKTELAKALAEFLFGDPHRLTRFDMSEFSDPVSVQRLIAGSSGEREGLLTARIREQPFSVLLLDEFEKADPLFFDLLLQVLGEARLTDAQGRLADFSNAVIILTSNLGAQDFQRGRPGLTTGPSEAPAADRHFTDAVQAFVRPELYNRFDRVVPFQSLGQDVILDICKRELEQIRRRDGIGQRGVDLATPDDVIAWLARAGYDPLYGARPLQRTIEKQLLAPLSTAINAYPAEHALVAETAVRGEKLEVRVHAKVDAAGRPVLARASLSHEAALARRATDLRRKLQCLDRSGEFLEVVNEFYRLENFLKRVTKRGKGKHTPFDTDRYHEFRTCVNQLRETVDNATALEESSLLQLYGMADADAGTANAVSALEHNWRGLLLQVYALQFDEPHRVTLSLFGEKSPFLFRIAREYLSLAREHRYQVSCYRYFATPTRDEKTGKEGDKPEHMLTRVEREDRETDAQWREKIAGRPLRRERLADPGAFLSRTNVSAHGFGFEFSGRMAFVRFCTEAGHHVLAVQRNRYPCLVETCQVPLKHYIPPEGIERMGGLPPAQTRRTYAPPLQIIDDPLLETFRETEAIRLQSAMERYLQQCAEQLLK